MVWWGNAGAALPAAEIFVPFALLPESLPISKLPKFVHAHSGGSRSVEEVLSSVGSGLPLSHWTSVTSYCFLLEYWVQLSSTDLWAFYNYHSTLSTFEELRFHDVFFWLNTPVPCCLDTHCPLSFGVSAWRLNVPPRLLQRSSQQNSSKILVLFMDAVLELGKKVHSGTYQGQWEGGEWTSYMASIL